MNNKHWDRFPVLKLHANKSFHRFRSQVEKKTKPQDLIRLYDSIIDNCTDILNLTGASANAELKEGFEARANFYRAFRFNFITL